MPARTSRLERITNLFLALLDTTRPMPLREIGTAIAGYPSEPRALRQAFERDKRVLRDKGIPVETERIGGDDQVGYRILKERYYLPDLGLDAEEEEALAFAVAAVRLEGGGGGDVLAKLGSTGRPELPPVVVLPTLPALAPLQEAIRHRTLALFVYRGRAREVEPYGLLFRSGAWYLVGRDRTSGKGGATRTFRVDRIEGEPRFGPPGAYDLPEGFDAAAELRAAPWAVPGTEACEVVVEVDVREAPSARRLAGEGAVERRLPDGSLRLRFRVGDEEAFVAWVLGCGDGVEVIEPPELRARVVEMLLAWCS